MGEIEVAMGKLDDFKFQGLIRLFLKIGSEIGILEV